MTPKILLTNDDGIRADGLGMLASRLADLGELWVVAPDRERSATSHAFTLNEPLRVSQVAPYQRSSSRGAGAPATGGAERAGEGAAPRWFAVSGTPADCVYLGLLELCRGVSLVVSGINHGYNLGADVFYSGTVAGAIEAALRGVPAIAMSTGAGPGGFDFAAAAHLAHALAHAVLTEGLPPQTLLNVNVPAPPAAAGPSRGYAWTRLGRRVYRDHVECRTDPRGNTYYWIGGGAAPSADEPGTDLHAVHRGVASVTPLGLDLTHAELLRRLPSWRLRGFEAITAAEAEPALPVGDQRA